ncbi:hypothetical protein MRB53_041911 [Persea americana]|nr:hypothetical protein MRB53_041911 [Persea americana]
MPIAGLKDGRFSAATLPHPPMPSSLLQLDSLHLDAAQLIRQLSNALFASNEQMITVTEEYFYSVHPWIPFLSREHFRAKLKTHPLDTQTLMLVLCMRLLLDVPQAPEDTSKSQLYMSVSRVVSLYMTEKASLHTVQCKLMIALYEMGHGATDEAYLSLGACSRMLIVAEDKLAQHDDAECIAGEGCEQAGLSLSLNGEFRTHC